MTRAEIQRNAKLRKIAKLLRKRVRLLDRLDVVILDESSLEWKTANAIEKFLAQKKE